MDDDNDVEMVGSLPVDMSVSCSHSSAAASSPSHPPYTKAKTRLKNSVLRPETTALNHTQPGTSKDLAQSKQSGLRAKEPSQRALSCGAAEELLNLADRLENDPNALLGEAESSLLKRKFSGEHVAIRTSRVRCSDDEFKTSEDVYVGTSDTDRQASKMSARGMSTLANSRGGKVVTTGDREPIKHTIGVDLTGGDWQEEDESCLDKNMRESTTESGTSLVEDNSVIDLDEEDLLLIDELDEAGMLPEFIRAAQHRSHRPAAVLNLSDAGRIPMRNPPLKSSCVSRQEVALGGSSLRVGKVIQSKSGDLWRIKDIVHDCSDDLITLRCHRLQACKFLNGLLAKKMMELCFMVETDLDDPRHFLEQSVTEILFDQVDRLRQANFTNQVFPNCSFRGTASFDSAEHVYQEAPFAVRWRYTCKFANARERLENKYAERVMERLRTEDLVNLGRGALAIWDPELRATFRGETILGGSHRPDDPPVRGRIVAATDLSREQRWLMTKLPNYPDHARDLVGPSWFRDASSVDDETSVSGGITVDMTGNEGIVVSVRGVQENVRQEVSSIGLHDKSEQKSIIRPRISNRAAAAVASGGHTQNQSPSKPLDLFSSSLATPPLSGEIRREVPAVKRLSIGIPGQKYTYGDGFCGAGGATRGAIMAGLEPKWGFDFNRDACQTWHKNFPNAVMYKMWADELITRCAGNPDLKVDVLHLSPPCQFFSPAHTVSGKDDDMNSAAMFACGLLLDVAKPRLVTLEQTFGMMSPRFRGFFNALINEFTSKNFSLRWKLCPLQDWGLPQRRNRLAIIAACPGEVLPEFPKYTHANVPRTDRVTGLRPWATVNNLICGIPLGAPDHDIAGMEAKGGNNAPWDGDSIAPRCITTHGGQLYHPSGKRGFTNREFAALQGFPPEHVFSNQAVKKQIGNAVPPLIARVLFNALRHALEKADGVSTPPPEVVLLDD